VLSPIGLAGEDVHVVVLAPEYLVVRMRCLELVLALGDVIVSLQRWHAMRIVERADDVRVLKVVHSSNLYTQH